MKTTSLLLSNTSILYIISALQVTGFQLEKVCYGDARAFTALIDLRITSFCRNVPALPTEFLGGSAPCLQRIYLRGIPFLGLLTLLLSASDLIFLYPHNIPPTGYISPEAMVVGLAALPKLDEFVIKFQSATHRPDRVRPPPTARIVLPVLTHFRFKGASEYLEDLVAHIDSPQLDKIEITYLNQLIDFQVVRPSKFIDRSLGPKLTLFEHAQVCFYNSEVSFGIIHQHAKHPAQQWVPVRTSIKCKGIDWQVSHTAQVLSQLSVTLSIVNHLQLHSYSENPPFKVTDVEY